MCKKDLVTILTNNVNEVLIAEDRNKISQRAVDLLLNSFTETVMDAVSNGEDVRLIGFGNFVAEKRNGYTGRNPKTGEPVEIAAHRVPKFKPSAVFKDIVR